MLVRLSRTTLRSYYPEHHGAHGTKKVYHCDDQAADMGVKNWKQRAQERKQWKEIIEQAKTHKEL
jgi:hypothetical protein